MNKANKLTVLRIILVPIMVFVHYYQSITGFNGTFLNIPITNWIIILIFSIASYTDHLDGKIARKENMITDFGKFADPLADKILVLTAMLLLVENGKLPAWIPVIVLFREFAVSGYRLIAVQKEGKVIAANIWGKMKTVTQMFGIVFMYLSKFSYFQFIFRVSNINAMYQNSASIYMTTGEYIINILASIFITISVIATLISGWSYLKNGKELLKNC